MKIVDISGQRFGRLTAIKKIDTNRNGALWLCKCDCGQEKTATLSHLKYGHTKSCGCLKRETRTENGHKSGIGERSWKHGDFGTRLYGVWAGMKRRCNNPNTRYYSGYGGRGIRVCDEWQEYIPFKEWALRAGYIEGMSIERINVNEDYCPGNCTWIPLTEQNSNKRNTDRIMYQNRQYTIKELARMTGIKAHTIRSRYDKGWSADKIVNTKLAHAK